MTKFYLLVTLLYILTKGNIQVNAQVDSSISDPRKYIKLYKVDGKNEELIGEWKNTSNIYTQLFYAVDIKSSIKIQFEVSGLENNENVLGNISLGAKINDRKLEVSPYSEVGENQKILLNAKQPQLIAANYRSLINSAILIYDNINRIQNTVSNNINIDEDYRGIKDLLIKLFVNRRGLYDSTIDANYLNSEIKITNEKLKDFRNISEINTIISQIEYFLQQSGKQQNDKTSIPILNFPTSITAADSDIVRISTIKSTKQQLQDMTMFFDYFHNSGEQTENIFINLSGSNKTTIDIIKNRIKESVSKLSFLDTLKFQYYKDYYSNIREILINIQYYIGQIRNISIPENLLNLITKNIFNKLVYATIDLEKSSATEGDNLFIYVYNYSNEEVVTENSKPVELEIAKFKLLKLGWEKFKVSDSFMLVKSNYGSPDTTDQFIPSKYQPVPGVSLLFSYSGTGKNEGDVWNVLYPSIGINLSYLNFYQNKDVEVGIGFTSGLFNNRIFSTIGWNLAASKGKSFYWGFGFSFTNLANSFTSKTTE